MGTAKVDVHPRACGFIFIAWDGMESTVSSRDCGASSRSFPTAEMAAPGTRAGWRDP